MGKVPFVGGLESHSLGEGWKPLFQRLNGWVRGASVGSFYMPATPPPLVQPHTPQDGAPHFFTTTLHTFLQPSSGLAPSLLCPHRNRCRSGPGSPAGRGRTCSFRAGSRTARLGRSRVRGTRQYLEEGRGRGTEGRERIEEAFQRAAWHAQAALPGIPEGCPPVGNAAAGQAAQKRFSNCFRAQLYREGQRQACFSMPEVARSLALLTSIFYH